MKSKSALLRVGGWFVRLFYRMEVSGLEHLPEGGCLLLPNHVTWVDAILLQVASPRPIRFLVYEPIYRKPLLNPIFRLLKAIPVTSRRAKDSMKQAVEQVAKGEIVCIFPEGQISRNGSLLKLRRGYELVARASQAPVVPVWLDQLWGSIFSYQGNRAFFKIPKQIPYPLAISFGQALPHDQCSDPLLRERLLELGEAAFSRRPFLQGHLGIACLRGLKKKQFDTVVVDGMDQSTMSRGTLLAAAIVLSRHLRAHCSQPRIAVILPPGKGAVVANLAILLADKVPVNLNFTAGRAAVEAAIRIGQLGDVITAGAMLKKVGDLPLPENVLYLEKILPPLKSRIALWRAFVLVTPWWLLASWLKIPREGGEKEAVVLFTSGSSGEPKGVTLSHRNILGNVSQFGQMLSLSRRDAILASLPFFHSFGCTVTLWFPMIEGIRMVTYPNPLDVEKNAELVERHHVTLLLATPTFLRGYLRRATKEQLASVKLLVTGAEKLPRDLAEGFEEKFGIPVLEGYGLTETSPVVSVNLPEPPKRTPDDEVQPSSRPGSVGKLAPGIAAQIRDPESGKLLSLYEKGMLWLRGVNIFEGYLYDPKKTAEVIRDGWFQTGDLARFDEDGFLYIEGRISRFSKIGGEMIPHESLENRICDLLELESQDERTTCIVGIPDPAKGEALVLLTTREIDLAALRSGLLAAGVPSLWIPKKVVRVGSIPVLGSGKLDLRGCREAALSGVG